MKSRLSAISANPGLSAKSNTLRVGDHQNCLSALYMSPLLAGFSRDIPDLSVLSPGSLPRTVSSSPRPGRMPTKLSRVEKPSPKKTNSKVRNTQWNFGMMKAKDTMTDIAILYAHPVFSKFEIMIRCWKEVYTCRAAYTIITQRTPSEYDCGKRSKTTHCFSIVTIAQLPFIHCKFTTDNINIWIVHILTTKKAFKFFFTVTVIKNCLVGMITIRRTPYCKFTIIIINNLIIHVLTTKNL